MCVCHLVVLYRVASVPLQISLRERGNHIAVLMETVNALQSVLGCDTDVKVDQSVLLTNTAEAPLRGLVDRVVSLTSSVYAAEERVALAQGGHAHAVGASDAMTVLHAKCRVRNLSPVP